MTHLTDRRNQHPRAVAPRRSRGSAARRRADSISDAVIAAYIHDLSRGARRPGGATPSLAVPSGERR